MFCRRALQRLAPLTRRAANPSLLNGAPARHMSIGIPGTNHFAYYLLGGGGLTAAIVYAYKTVRGDGEVDVKPAAPEAKLAPVTPEPTEEAVAIQVEPVAVEEAVPAVAEELPAETPAEPQVEAVAPEAASETAAEPEVLAVPEEAVPQECAAEVIPEETAAVSADVPEATVEDVTGGEAVTVETIAEEAPVAVEEVAAVAEVPPTESEGTAIVVEAAPEKDIPSPAEYAPSDLEVQAPAATAVAA